MTILGLEFSSPQRSVAVWRDGVQTGEVTGADGRETHAFGMIEKVLALAKLERGQIGAIAVGLGPGSYTGIRVAIAIARGWQLARGVKLLGVSSAETLAAQAQAENIFGRVNVVMDAQRNEIYLAGYEITESDRKEIEPLKILSPETVSLTARGVLADGHRSRPAIFLGPEATRWFPAGKILFPRAAVAAAVAANRSDVAADGRLEPIYLRATNYVKAPQPRILL